MSGIKELYIKLVQYNDKVASSLLEISELSIVCKYILTTNLKDPNRIDSAAVLKIQALIDYIYEQINIGNWKDVKLYLRKTMTIASYLKLLGLIQNSSDVSEEVIRESYKIIDYGLMFGCPLDTVPCLLQNCATVISSFHLSASNNKTTKSEIETLPVQQPNLNYHGTPLEVINCPSMEHFYTNYILKERPVVLDDCINHWPALTKWKIQDYFIELAGLRTVAIELGSKYTDTEWTQKLMTVEDFIKKHICQSDGPKGYLAQYQLFDQIPELRKDIEVPDYCCFAEKDDPVDIMAWYGPKGTLSPLHHDPKKNLLAQVVGEKQIFLFSPQDSEFLYLHDHELLSNTAEVDPRNPDLEKYPKYKNANALHCTLRSGQMLYIPPKWWHFVESLSISFSVSFWWE